MWGQRAVARPAGPRPTSIYNAEWANEVAFVDIQRVRGVGSLFLDLHST